MAEQQEGRGWMSKLSKITGGGHNIAAQRKKVLLCHRVCHMVEIKCHISQFRIRFRNLLCVLSNLRCILAFPSDVCAISLNTGKWEEIFSPGWVLSNKLVCVLMWPAVIWQIRENRTGQSILLSMLVARFQHFPKFYCTNHRLHWRLVFTIRVPVHVWCVNTDNGQLFYGPYWLNSEKILVQ